MTYRAQEIFRKSSDGAGGMIYHESEGFAGIHDEECKARKRRGGVHMRREGHGELSGYNEGRVHEKRQETLDKIGRRRAACTIVLHCSRGLAGECVPDGGAL